MADPIIQPILPLQALSISASDLSKPTSALDPSATSTSHTIPANTPPCNPPPDLPAGPTVTTTNTLSSSSSSSSRKLSRPFEFGQRHLSDTANPFDFNAWDHVTPPASHLSWAESQYALQRAAPVSSFDAALFNAEPARWWNRFYANNTANFFKDRKWLRQEFPVLQAATAPGAGPKRVLEIGAGAGNTAFPIVRGNENPEFRLFACDFSRRAVELVRASPEFNEAVMEAEVWDFSSPGDLPRGVEENSMDVVLLIFTFSALSPAQWAQAVRNVWRVLKPGGEVCFRDYGRGDLAQVRFRKGRWMDENFYVRGDGTRVYFFDEDELRRIWGGAERGKKDEVEGERPETEAEKTEENNVARRDETTEPQEGTKDSPVEQPDTLSFEILDLGVDRRLTVNRKEQLMMYRCWMQGRFRKPFLQESSSSCGEHVDVGRSSHSNRNGDGK